MYENMKELREKVAHLYGGKMKLSPHLSRRQRGYLKFWF